MVEYLIGFTFAIALGGLVGIERAYHSKDAFAGTRTFILICFLGALAKFLADVTASPYIFIIVLILFFILVIVSYIFSAWKGFIGITTELTALITFILGAMVMTEEYRNYAILLLVSIVTILTLKTVFQKIVKKTKPIELFDTIKFLIIAFVILPILPDLPLSELIGNQPFYIILPEVIQTSLNSLNFHTIWEIVVLYAGTGFLGYFLIRLLGSQKGLTLNGFFGGLTSVSAVNNSLLEYSTHHRHKAVIFPLLASLALANFAMLIRIVVLISFISITFTEQILLPLVALMLFNILAFLFFNFQKKHKKKWELNVKNPLNLASSLRFGGIFILIIILSQLFLEYLGSFGLYLVGLFTGGIQITGYILNVSDLFEKQELLFTTAYIATAIVLFSGSLSKGILNYIKVKNDYSKYSLYYYIASAFVILLTFILI